MQRLVRMLPCVLPAVSPSVEANAPFDRRDNDAAFQETSHDHRFIDADSTAAACRGLLRQHAARLVLPAAVQGGLLCALVAGRHVRMPAAHGPGAVAS